MAYREKYWRGYWEASPGKRERLSGVVDELRVVALAAAEDLKPLGALDVHRAARAPMTDTAAGVDHWAPRSLLLLHPSA
eukprot:5012475-Pyramimonas_sp.AAC.1